MQKQESENPFANMQIAAKLLIFMARIWSLPMTVLLHWNYGPRFLGLAGGFAIVPMAIFPLFFPRSNPAPLYMLLTLYLLRTAGGRIAHIYRLIRKRPLTSHTEYSGCPLILKFFPTWSEEAVQWLEPLGVFLFGLGTVWLSRPLGWYLILAGIAQYAWEALRYVYTWNQVATLRDKAIEQRIMAERIREFEVQ